MVGLLKEEFNGYANKLRQSHCINYCYKYETDVHRLNTLTPSVSLYENTKLFENIVGFYEMRGVPFKKALKLVIGESDNLYLFLFKLNGDIINPLNPFVPFSELVVHLNTKVDVFIYKTNIPIEEDIQLTPRELGNIQEIQATLKTTFDITTTCQLNTMYEEGYKQMLYAKVGGNEIKDRDMCVIPVNYAVDGNNVIFPWFGAYLNKRCNSAGYRLSSIYSGNYSNSSNNRCTGDTTPNVFESMNKLQQHNISSVYSSLSLPNNYTDVINAYAKISKTFITSLLDKLEKPTEVATDGVS